MKTKLQLLVLLFLLATALKTIAQPSAGGIVYGPKGAFNMGGRSMNIDYPEKPK